MDYTLADRMIRQIENEREPRAFGDIAVQINNKIRKKRMQARILFRNDTDVDWEMLEDLVYSEPCVEDEEEREVYMRDLKLLREAGVRIPDYDYAVMFTEDVKIAYLTWRGRVKAYFDECKS